MFNKLGHLKHLQLG